MSRIRLILLSMLAVLAVSVVASASASANMNCGEGGTLGVWCVNAAEFNGNETTEAKIKSASFVLKGGITIECTALKTKGASITGTEPETGNGTDKVQSIEFSGCKVKGDGTGLNRKCKVEDNKAGAVDGTIRTEELSTVLKVRTFEAKARVFDVFKPTTAASFVNIVIANESGKTCLVPTATYEVTGESCGLTAEAEAVEAGLAFSEAIEKACATEKPLKLKGVAASLTGESSQTMTGANKGLKWGTGES